MNNLKEQIQSVVSIYKTGNLSKAESLTKKLIEDNPKVVFLYNFLGLILVGQKKNKEAMKFYEQGIKIDPNYGMIYNNIGLLMYENKSRENLKIVEKYYKKAIQLDKNIPEPHNNLGSLYETLDKVDEAISCYQKAILINANFSYAHHNLGTSYISLGKFDEAKIHLKKSLKLNPNFMQTHRMLSRITKYTDDNEHLNELKKIYKNLKADNEKNKIEICFALGKAHEDTKKFNDSFNYYKEANFLQRKYSNFSINEERKKFDYIKSLYNKKLFEKYKNCGYPDYKPIFIIGMPRSSTTLIEQILSSHPKVFGCGEIELIPNLIDKNFGEKDLSLFFENILGSSIFSKDDFRKIGEDYINNINRISNNSERYTDKLPKNFLYFGFIKLILPNAKIIHSQRNAKDNCLSIFKNHFPSGSVSFAYDLNEIIEYYNLYNDLMNYWNQLFPDFLLNIQYENLVSNTKHEIEKLLKFCDLQWDDSCLNFYKNKRQIKTASDTQVRSKIYSNSVNSWKNYEKELNEFFSKLKLVN